MASPVMVAMSGGVDSSVAAALLLDAGHEVVGVTMKLWGERTFAEIGEALDISLNTAASRYRYGIEALRKQLAKARLNGDI